MSDFNYECNQCPRTFKLEEFYEKHKKVHELKKQHRCDVCGFVYGAAKGLEGHLKTHSDLQIAHAAATARGLARAAVQSTPSPPSLAPNESPINVDFHFLNPRGVLAQAKLPLSPPKGDNLEKRLTNLQHFDKAPSPAGTGNYEIFGKLLLSS